MVPVLVWSRACRYRDTQTVGQSESWVGALLCRTHTHTHTVEKSSDTHELSSEPAAASRLFPGLTSPSGRCDRRGGKVWTEPVPEEV